MRTDKPAYLDTSGTKKMRKK